MVLAGVVEATAGVTVRDHIAAGRWAEATTWLERELHRAGPGAFREAQVQAQRYALGVLALRQSQMERAEQYLLSVHQLKGLYRDWAAFHLGSLYRQRGQWRAAQRYLRPLTQRRQSLRLRRDSRLELAEMAAQRQHWKTARQHLYYLERRVRGESEYPQILWKLVGVEKRSRRQWKACRWARKLYAKYPSHALVAKWTMDLKNNRYAEKPLGCVPTLRDQQTRIRRLQWAGLNQKARQEIDWLLERSTESTRFHTDQIRARFFIGEGQASEALQVLLPYYEKHHKNFNYLMLLGQAAARAMEYKTAVGAYYAAHRLNQRSSLGRKALFQAAFLSYQFQDYDGAGRKFEEFNRKYRRSGLVRDSFWHLAWIRYLKRDYRGAHRAFAEILQKKRRRRRFWRSFDSDRIHYWLAMSLKKMGEGQKAAQHFQDLAQSRVLSYYSIASRQRLSQLNTLQLRSVAQATEKIWSPKEEDLQDERTEKKVVRGEEGESEETMARLEDLGEEDEEAAAADGEAEVEDPEFKNPRWANHFARAKNFIKLGLNRAAKWELYEIERRSRKEEHLKALMHQYQLINSYHRSAYIGQVYFTQQRHRYGMEGVRYLWEFAYPRAYRESVSKYAADFLVPEELVWSIMRAESHFRVDATSVVGAQGLMQLMPYTARHVVALLDGDRAAKNFSVTDLTQPAVNVRLGTRYLRRLSKKFEGKLPLVAGAYNAGPHRVDNWLSVFGRLDMDEFIEHIPFVQTRNYVKKVMRNFHIYHRLYSSQEQPLALLSEPVGLTPKTSDFSRENWDTL